MSQITNNEIKEIRSLREKKFRDELGLFVVEGEKMVAEALSSEMEVVRVIRRDDIGETAMSRISAFSTPSPVLALVRIPERKAVLPETGLCLGLDAVRDPGNLGTILRIADWFGVKSVFASEDTVDVFNPKVIQASMGAIFRKRLVYCDLPGLCREFTEAGRPVFGTFLDGRDIYGEELAPDGLIVMGNEANGISDEVAAYVSDRLFIPSYAEGKGAESLNVAVATAVTVAEFKRRGL